MDCYLFLMCFSVVSSFSSSFNFSFLFSHFANCTIPVSVSARCKFECMGKFYIKPFNLAFWNRPVCRWWCPMSILHAHVNFPNLPISMTRPDNRLHTSPSNSVALKLLFVSLFFLGAMYVVCSVYLVVLITRFYSNTFKSKKYISCCIFELNYSKCHYLCSHKFSVFSYARNYDQIVGKIVSTSIFRHTFLYMYILRFKLKDFSSIVSMELRRVQIIVMIQV